MLAGWAEGHLVRRYSMPCSPWLPSCRSVRLQQHDQRTTASALAAGDTGRYTECGPTTTTHLRSLPRYLTDRAPSPLASPRVPRCPNGLRSIAKASRERWMTSADGRRAAESSRTPFLQSLARHLRPIESQCNDRNEMFIVRRTCQWLHATTRFSLLFFLLVFFLLCSCFFRSQSHGLREGFGQKSSHQNGRGVRCACRFHLRC